MKDINNYEMVEIVVPASSTNQRIFFLDQPKLRNTALTGIETFSVGNIATAPSGNPVVNEALFAGTYLVLVDVVSSEEKMFQLPLPTLRRLHDQTGSEQYVTNLIGFNGMKVNYSKSYVYISNPASIAAQVESFCFGIFYVPLPQSTR